MMRPEPTRNQEASNDGDEAAQELTRTKLAVHSPNRPPLADLGCLPALFSFSRLSSTTAKRRVFRGVEACCHRRGRAAARLPDDCRCSRWQRQDTRVLGAIPPKRNEIRSRDNAGANVQADPKEQCGRAGGCNGCGRVVMQDRRAIGTMNRNELRPRKPNKTRPTNQQPY